ncbi:hypothetical protein A73_8 [Escherichia phage A73]|uniref:Uncharacterized protein n=1 Tax=Escherichia phage A73 TaxID=3003819 RepID=A0AAF0AQJ7_9CAUD|nr:hypothetical protein [Escherichia phage UPEC06]WBF77682.1 hypothetical protein A73_8 [Escherichia phage A73]
MAFTITSYTDVANIAKTFGPEALKYAVSNGKLTKEQCYLIGSCKRWAASRNIEIENVNDGNIEYSVDAVFKAVYLGGIYNTNLNDVRIVRTGFGAYDVPVREAMEKGYINPAILSMIMTEAKERNEVRAILGL